MPGDVVCIEHIAVRRDRIVAEAKVLDGRYAHTTPDLIVALLSTYPHLLEHTCVNGQGRTFGDVAFDTPLPHLIEHMAIENQVRTEQRGRGTSFLGKSYWVDRATLRARIELSYANDLVAMAALRDAVRDIDHAAANLSP